MSKIAIIADSGCQIDINGEHEGIYIAPLCIGHGSQTYLDQLEITSLDVFNLICIQHLSLRLVL